MTSYVLQTKNEPQIDHDVTTLTSWDYIDSEGEKHGMTAPAAVPGLEVGETFTVETILPSVIEPGTWFAVRSSRDMAVYIDGVQKFEFVNDRDVDLIGGMVKSQMFFVELQPSDAGKLLTITRFSPDRDNGALAEAYVGNPLGLVSLFIRERALPELLDFALILVAGLAAICGMVLEFKNHRILPIVSLSIGLFFVALWVLFDSYIFEFLFHVYYMDGFMAYFMAMLAPFPILMYLDRLQKNRYRPAYLVLGSLSLISTLLFSTLHLLEIVSFRGTMTFIHGIMILQICGAIVLIIHDAAKGRSKNYRYVVVGMILFVACCVAEIIQMTFAFGGSDGLFVLLGLYILLGAGGLQQVYDSRMGERERRLAIAASESKTAFLANMSHEIRTPINSIIGMNEMILRETHDPQIREYAQHVESAGKTLLGLINDVLDFSKIEAGKMDIIESPYQTAQVFGDLLQILKERASAKELEVRFGLDENVPKALTGDEVRVKQVITNLLSNATKYTQSGSVTFAVSALNTDVKDMCTLKIVVSDTGMGIREENLNKLFDSFVRVDQKKNRSIEGTGLGLSITKRLVDAMNGEITVESQYGCGTRFTVLIPQTIADPEPVGDLEKALHARSAKRSKYKESFHAPGAHVLVVDDNSTNLLIVKKLLKNTQIQIETASGGREAIDKCQKDAFDIILMDHLMPEMDGIEALHEIRKNEGVNLKTPVIALTANAIEGIRQYYLGEGFDDYLSKPIDPHALEEMLLKFIPAEKVERIEEVKAEPEA